MGTIQHFDKKCKLKAFLVKSEEVIGKAPKVLPLGFGPDDRIRLHLHLAVQIEVRLRPAVGGNARPRCV